MKVRRTWLAKPVIDVIGEVWEFIKDDSPEELSNWLPRLTDDSRWYISTEDDEVVGAFWMRRVNAITWEAHANVRPKFWGDKKGTAHCKAAIEEMMFDTQAEKIIALIPDSSPEVQRMAEAIGFKREGRQVRSFLKNGEYYDQIHYGITRK